MVPLQFICSLLLLKGRTGNVQIFDSAGKHSKVLDRTVSAKIVSVKTGKWAPCCSVAPIGKITIASSFRSSDICFVVSLGKKWSAQAFPLYLFSISQTPYFSF